MKPWTVLEFIEFLLDNDFHTFRRGGSSKRIITYPSQLFRTKSAQFHTGVFIDWKSVQLKVKVHLLQQVENFDVMSSNLSFSTEGVTVNLHDKICKANEKKSKKTLVVQLIRTLL